MRLHFKSVTLVLLFTCLNYYELARAQQSRRLLKRARQHKRRLDKMQISDRPNMLPCLLAILEAEDLSSHRRGGGDSGSNTEKC
jgi:hypothetical protein